MHSTGALLVHADCCELCEGQRLLKRPVRSKRPYPSGELTANDNGQMLLALSHCACSSKGQTSDERHALRSSRWWLAAQAWLGPAARCMDVLWVRETICMQDKGLRGSGSCLLVGDCCSVVAAPAPAAALRLRSCTLAARNACSAMESNDPPCDVGEGLQPHLTFDQQTRKKVQQRWWLAKHTSDACRLRKGRGRGRRGAWPNAAKVTAVLSISTLAARVTAGACSVRLTRWDALFRPFYTDVAGEDACLQPGEQFSLLLHQGQATYPLFHGVSFYCSLM